MNSAVNDDDELLEPDAAEVDEDVPQPIRIRIRRKLPGRRLDKYLHGRFPRLSRTMIQKLIKSGDITVNDRPTKPSYEMEAGDRVDLLIPPPEPYELIPENIPLDIIYEDDYVLAINKPIGIICHPARATQSGTIANALAYYARSLSTGSDAFRPGIVHRLDKNTSGVMIVAKTDEAHWRLSRQFEQRTTRKIYLGVVHGNLELDADEISVPIAAHPSVHDRYVVSGVAARLGGRFQRNLGKEAVTRYEVVERYGAFCLVRLFPKTGRTHQLRVHMSHIGHPMVGDPFYGGSHVSLSAVTGRPEDSAEPIMTRQALHAWKLIVVHPIRETPLELSAEPPADMRRLIELLRQHRRAR
ncbi:MAG: RluA family pseudouridine synthase [Phycisphaerae bacterium]|nr:RluA family pseudouridine synthase [Phycisphaerae bacterium]NUQ48192.1 RluA family pseudouridine synthase [Phycisphaerae bacterium]